MSLLLLPWCGLDSARDPDVWGSKEWELPIYTVEKGMQPHQCVPSRSTPGQFSFICDSKNYPPLSGGSWLERLRMKWNKIRSNQEATSRPSRNAGEIFQFLIKNLG